jgi:exopolysaccharide production protein ExoZ
VRIAAIDGLRAIAVLAVLGHHVGLLPWAIGTRGVDIFFVISGLCLSLPALREGKGLRPMRFWIARFWRIVPPYWVALAVFGALSLTAFAVPAALSAPKPFEFLEDGVFFTSLAPAYNPSFWTLGYEARWYVFFPFILALYLKNRFAFFAMMAGFYVCYASPFRIPDAGILPCFMLGIVAADLYLRGLATSRLVIAAAVGLVILAAVFVRSTEHGDPLWHLAAFCVVLAGLGAASKAMSWKPLVFIGGASYSIYLVHQPFVAWMFAHHVGRIPAALVAIGLGVVFWRLVEVPSLAMRAVMRRGRTLSTRRAGLIRAA